LKWSESGAAEGNLIFVSGHPAHGTRRHGCNFSTSGLSVPGTLNLLRRREVLLAIIPSATPKTPAERT